MRATGYLLVLAGALGALTACSASSSPQKETTTPDASLGLILPDARADTKRPSADAKHDAPVDAGWDATAACESADASSTLSCGSLAFAKSPLASRARNHHLTAIAQAKNATSLYVIGGFGGTEGSITWANVDRAPIQADGSLGAFVSETPLPVAVGGATGGVVGNAILIAGGLTSTNAVVDTSYTAVIHDDGSLGAWVAGGSIVNGRMHAGSVVRGNTIWILGGFDDETVWSDIVSATVAADGTLSAWTSAGKLPGPRSHFSVDRDGDYVYIAGGLAASAFDNPPDLQDVWRGQIETDGTIGNWTQLVNLAAAEATHASFLYGGYLHVCGGINNVPAQEDRCWRAPLLADHTLGAFDEIASLLIARGHVHQMPVFGRNVYSVAGATDFSLDSTTEIDIGTYETDPTKMTGKAAPKAPRAASAEPLRKGFKCHMGHEHVMPE